MLAFPPGANLSGLSEYSDVSDLSDLAASEVGAGVNGKIAAVHGQADGVENDQDERQEQEAVEGTSGGNFGPIPDEAWGSDHLALGVELSIL